MNLSPRPVKKTPRPMLSGPRLAPSTGAPTRADALLASFGSSSSEEAMMAEAAASLKSFAFEPTAAPPAVKESSSAKGSLFSGLPAELDRLLPSTSPPPVEAQSPLTTIPTPMIPSRVKAAPPPPAQASELPPSPPDELSDGRDDETPVTRIAVQAPRKGRPGISVAAAILAGTLAGLVAVARLRPDLVTSLEERIGPALSGSPESPTPPPSPLPAPAPPPSAPPAR